MRKRHWFKLDIQCPGHNDRRQWWKRFVFFFVSKITTNCPGNGLLTMVLYVYLITTLVRINTSRKQCLKCRESWCLHKAWNICSWVLYRRLRKSRDHPVVLQVGRSHFLPHGVARARVPVRSPETSLLLYQPGIQVWNSEAIMCENQVVYVCIKTDCN